MSHDQSVPGHSGRRIHVAHRRTPSEMTPLMLEHLALQQQIDDLKENLSAAQSNLNNQFPVNMSAQAALLNQAAAMGAIGTNTAQFQYPQIQQPVQMPMGSHRRNQSALPNFPMSSGPPPAPSAGSSGSTYSDFPSQANYPHSQSRENSFSGRGAGHSRRHSLALPEARKAAELAQQKRTTSSFQFPAASSGQANPSAPTDNNVSNASNQSYVAPRAGNTRGTGHTRSQSLASGNSRNNGGFGSFQFPSNDDSSSNRRQSHGFHSRVNSCSSESSNWRNTQEVQTAPMGSIGQQNNGQQNNNGNSGGSGHSSFQPGHRSRQSTQSVSNIPFPFAQKQQPMFQVPQPMAIPQLFAGQQYNAPQQQIAQLQAMQISGHINPQVLGLAPGQNINQMFNQNQNGMNGNQQQRKTLFTPYLPQATLPALINDGQLVAGILRVNKKNRSDAYVTSPELDADIFICGSKDRNRALEGDLVAVELLDVDEVWGQKREKEEKRKRKDFGDSRSSGFERSRSDSINGELPHVGPDGSIRRRGSLRQRPTQKKNDDVEVEGQSLLLVEEDEISDEQKPLYAGHVVAVTERVGGQIFSGSLGLLRPSSIATKEKQEAERHARVGSMQQSANMKAIERPKIVWFKPTDKRVPLIAIPTEQAPADFVQRHQEYANTIFVAGIKRWPITSLHPFGTLQEKLGQMGDLRVETDALLRDNNFASDVFNDTVLASITCQNWTAASDSELKNRADFRDKAVFTIDPAGDSMEFNNAFHIQSLDDNKAEIAIHVIDLTHFVESGSLVDREARKRGTSVYLMNRTVPMLPSLIAQDVGSLVPGKDRLTISVVFTVDLKTGAVQQPPVITKGIINSNGKISFDQLQTIFTTGQSDKSSECGVPVKDLLMLKTIGMKFREERFGNRVTEPPSLSLLAQLDDENVPVQSHIFHSTIAHDLVQEIAHKANHAVAVKLFENLGDNAFLRRHPAPNPRRLQKFVTRMQNLGYTIDQESSGSLQGNLFQIENAEIRQSMETLLFKSMSRAKYYLPSTVSDKQRQHYLLNLPIYTHFTSPNRRYGDIIVHRQLTAVLSGNAPEYLKACEDEHFNKLPEQCNNKKDSAHIAQEQSIHNEVCRAVNRKEQTCDGDLITEGIVLCVYESAFDVLLPEFGFEKRVHCDQLPLKKAEFRHDTRTLELYWEKGVASSSFLPEDEKSSSKHRYSASTSARETEASREQHEREESQRNNMDTRTISTDDVLALFDDDEEPEEDGVSTLEQGVSVLSVEGSAPQPDQAPNNATDEKKYLSMFALREQDGHCIQDVTELSRIPIILKTDLSKSPPCLMIRAMNPYAL